MSDVPPFRRDLFRGTAPYYDRYRIAYPQALIEDLLHGANIQGGGRLLDLACGTGLITFAMHTHFLEVWAVDQEPEMVDTVRTKAEAAGVRNVRCLHAEAEDLSVPEGSFELVAIGNAFHRFQRQVVAANAYRWLRPGGLLALLWGGNPWGGDADWERAMAATMERWMTRAGAHARVPDGFAVERAAKPDTQILVEAGFDVIGTSDFPTAHDWTVETIIGFAYSSSVLSREALGPLATAFEHDLRRELSPFELDGVLPATIDFACVLARRTG